MPTRWEWMDEMCEMTEEMWAEMTDGAIPGTGSFRRLRRKLTKRPGLEKVNAVFEFAEALVRRKQATITMLEALCEEQVSEARRENLRRLILIEAEFDRRTTLAMLSKLEVLPTPEAFSEIVCEADPVAEARFLLEKVDKGHLGESVPSGFVRALRRLTDLVERLQHPNSNQCPDCGQWNHERDSTYHCRCGEEELEDDDE